MNLLGYFSIPLYKMFCKVCVLLAIEVLLVRGEFLLNYIFLKLFFCFHLTWSLQWAGICVKKVAEYLCVDEFQAAAQKFWSWPIMRRMQWSAIIAERNQLSSLTSVWVYSEKLKNSQKPEQHYTSHCRKKPFIFHANLLNNWRGICCWWTPLCLVRKEIKTHEANTHACNVPLFWFRAPPVTINTTPHTSVSFHFWRILYSSTSIVPWFHFMCCWALHSSEIVQHYK